MNASTIGAFIAQIRKEKGWTQKELAERLNVSDKAVSKWETGRGTPDISSLESLSSVLEVSVNEILAGTRFEKGDFPKTSDKILVDTLRRHKKVWCIFIAVAVGTVCLLAAIFYGYHWLSTVSENDTAKIERLAIESTVSMSYNFNHIALENAKICASEKSGEYMAFLVQSEDLYYIVEMEQDTVFKSRWHYEGGTSSIKAGELSSFHMQNCNHPALIIVGGGDLPENAAYYAVRTQNQTFALVPIENGTVCNIHLQPNTYDLGSGPILLDKNLNTVRDGGETSFTEYLEG